MMQGLAGGGGGSSYQSTATSGAEGAKVGGASFGDVNVGAGAGSGLKFTPMMLGILGAVALAALFIWKR